MKLGFLILVAFFFIDGGRAIEGRTSEEPCLICGDFNCKCEVFGCGENEMSLKKLILYFLERAQRKAEEDEKEDDTLTPLVRILRDILKRASRLNINEEIGIRDMILSRLRTLQGKCPCLDLPHEETAKRFLRLLLEKCLVCECGTVPCEGVWSRKTCEAPTGMFWFRTTDENLRKERPKQGQRGRQAEEKVACGMCTDPCRRSADFDNSYKCGRFLGDESDAVGNGFSICTDCDNCQVVVLKGKDEVWLLCDGCKAIDSPYVRFTGGGCPVKATSVGRKRFIKVRTPYLQLNDFRPQEITKKPDRSDFHCPCLSRLKRKRSRRRKCR